MTALSNVAPAPTARGGRFARWLRPAVGIAISAFFLYLVLGRLSLPEVGATLERADLRFIPLALASLACGYALRITRWWLMLRTGTPTIGWRETGSPFLVSIAANNVLPLRIGDVLRMFAFRSRPGLEPSRIAGTLLVERLLDLLVLLAVFAGVLTQVEVAGALSNLVVLGRWAALAGVVAAFCVFSLPLIDRLLFARLRVSAAGRPLVLKLLAVEERLAQTIGAIARPRRFVALVLLSILVWTFEGGLFVSALAAFDPAHAVSAGIFALAVATLATLVPSSPGYIGTFHFFAIQALLVFGFDQTTAAAFAITAHLLLWLPTTLAGLLAFCWSMIRPSGRAGHLDEASSTP